MNNIVQNLIKFIKAIEEDINRDKFCTIIFKIQDGKVLRYEKTYSINLSEIR